MDTLTEIWNWFQVIVACPRWVVALAFLIGLVISTVSRALWSEWQMNRERDFWTKSSGPGR